MADAEVVVEAEKQPEEIISQREPAAEGLKTLESENTAESANNDVKIMVDSLEELSAVEEDGTINEKEYGEWNPLVDMSSASMFNASEVEESSQLPLSLKLPGEDSTSSVKRNDHSSTFLEMEFESEEMKKFLAYQSKTQPKYTSIEDMMYKPAELFPDWVYNDPHWNMVKRANSGTIMDILAVPESQRTPEHIYTVVEFVMSAWETAHQLGHKQTAQLFRDFKHVNVPEGEKIVVADDHCSLFYIIVGGEVVIEKKHRPHTTAKGNRSTLATPVISPRGLKTPRDQHKDKGSDQHKEKGTGPPGSSRQRRNQLPGGRKGSADHHDTNSVHSHGTGLTAPAIDAVGVANPPAPHLNTSQHTQHTISTVETASVADRESFLLGEGNANARDSFMSMNGSVLLNDSSNASVGEGEGQGTARSQTVENQRLKQAISQAVATVSEQGSGLVPKLVPGSGPDAEILQQLGSQSSSQVSSVQGNNNTTKRAESRSLERRSMDRRSDKNTPGQGLGPGQGKRNSVLLKGGHTSGHSSGHQSSHPTGHPSGHHHYGHTKEKEHNQKVILGQGKVFAEEILHKADLITLGYSVTALTSVDLLVLQKNDYDKFLKDIRSSERREIYVCLRDNWLCENWNRTRLERLTNACKKRTYEAGEYLFRQGDLPDVLYILFQGRVDLVKEIDFVCKNVLPVGLHAWEDRTLKKSRDILLKTIDERGMYFGEVSIIKDTTRATSAIAHTRSTLISIDKELFLNLIDSDKIVQLNQRIEFTDISILSKIRHVKGGPDSVVKTRLATYYPNKSIDRSDPRKEMIRSGRNVSPLPSPKRLKSPLPLSTQQQQSSAVQDGSSTDRAPTDRAPTDRAPTQAAVGLEIDQGTGGVGLNDGGVHTWLDVIKAIRQVQKDHPDAEAILKRDQEEQLARRRATVLVREQKHAQSLVNLKHLEKKLSVTNVMKAPPHALERRDSMVLETSERRMDLSQRKQSMYLPVIENLSMREAYYRGGSDRSNNANNNNNQSSSHNTTTKSTSNNHHHNPSDRINFDREDSDVDADDPLLDLEAWQPPSSLYDGDFPLEHPYEQSPPTSAEPGTKPRADSIGAGARPGVGVTRVAATAGSQLHHYMNEITYRGDNVLSGCALNGVDIPEGQIRSQHLLSSHKHPRVANPLVPLASHGLFGGPKPKPKPPTGLSANGMSLAVIERMKARPPFKVVTSGTAGGIEPLPLSVAIEERGEPIDNQQHYQHQQSASPNQYHNNNFNLTNTNPSNNNIINNNNNSNNNLPHQPPHALIIPSPIARHPSFPNYPTNDYNYLIDTTMSLKSHGSASIVDDSQKSWNDGPGFALRQGQGQGLGQDYREHRLTKPLVVSDKKAKENLALARARHAYALKLAHVAMVEKYQQNQAKAANRFNYEDIHRDIHRPLAHTFPSLADEPPLKAVLLSVQVTGVKEKQKETAMKIHQKLSIHNNNNHQNNNNQNNQNNNISHSRGYGTGSTSGAGYGIGGSSSAGYGGGNGGSGDGYNTDIHDQPPPETAPVLVSTPLVDLKKMVKRGPVFANKAKLTFKDCMLAD